MFYPEIVYTNLLAAFLTLSLELTIRELYVQLCAPDDGRRNRLKHVERL
jgi:hypothetical protein